MTRRWKLTAGATATAVLVLGGCATGDSTTDVVFGDAVHDAREPHESGVAEIGGLDVGGSDAEPDDTRDSATPIDAGSDAGGDVGADVTTDASDTSDVAHDTKPDSACPAGQTECVDGCFDLTKDLVHCGSCTTSCTSTEVCASGKCASVCASGTTKCGALCTDTKKDIANCGSCGHACAATETCVSGTCTPTCTGGKTLCGGACVDTGTDGSNCGGCGVVCTSGTTCAGGTCDVVCSGGTAKCGGTCIDVTSDPLNCGGCGVSCGACTTCSGSSCVATTSPLGFPSTTSSTKSGALGAGGGARFYQAGDYVQQTFTRSVCATSIDLNFNMEDFTDDFGCSFGVVGTLHFKVLVNGVAVGTYSFPGGTNDEFLGTSTTWSIKGTMPFASAIAPSGGTFTVRVEAMETVCPGGAAWNWIAGGTVTLK